MLHKHQAWHRFQWVKIHQLRCTSHKDQTRRWHYQYLQLNVWVQCDQCLWTSLGFNTILPPDAPLFAFKTADGSWSPLKQSWFFNHCNKIWCEEGLSSIKGHGFCIGRTRHLLLIGVDPWIMMVQGHWSSQAFLSYWWKCEEILSLFIGFSFQSRDSILTTMSTFKNCLTGK